MASQAALTISRIASTTTRRYANSNTAKISKGSFATCVLRLEVGDFSCLRSSTSITFASFSDVLACQFPTKLGKATKLRWKRGAPTVFSSSSSNPEPSTNEKANSSSDAADGPPLATILAGIVVFLLFCFIVGSIVMWLIGLITNPPSS